MTSARATIVEGTRRFWRSRSVVVGVVLWVAWSAVLYWLSQLAAQPIGTALALSVALWNLLLVYLILRSIFVRIEIDDEMAHVFGWFRNRVFHRREIRRIYHVYGPLPLVVLVSLGVRTIPGVWYLVIEHVDGRIFALDSTFSDRAASVEQLDGMLAWFNDNAHGGADPGA